MHVAVIKPLRLEEFSLVFTARQTNVFSDPLVHNSGIPLCHEIVLVIVDSVEEDLAHMIPFNRYVLTYLSERIIATGDIFGKWKRKGVVLVGVF